MIFRLTVLLAIAAGAAAAQTPRSPVPIRPVAPVVASTKVPLQEISSGVRELPGRRVLINDANDHRLLLFDSTLTTFTAIRDSISGPTGYGGLTSNLIPYLGDSSLFVDNPSQSFLLIDPAGKVIRPIAMPSARDINTLRRGIGPATDPRGRLVYRGPMQGTDYAIVRADFERRVVDTVGRYKWSEQRNQKEMHEGRERTRNLRDPMPMIDGWAMVADGSIAIVRGRDYHIDWIDLEGKVSSTPKMPFDWRRVTEEEKLAIIAAAREQQRVSDSASTAREAARPRPVDRPFEVMLREFYEPHEMSDYFPPIRSNAVLADRDNNVWILPTTTSQSQAGELVYDVVNRKGELFERVRLPAGRSIAGFGRNGVVYMMWRDQVKGWFIERTHVIRR